MTMHKHKKAVEGMPSYIDTRAGRFVFRNNRYKMVKSKKNDSFVEVKIRLMPEGELKVKVVVEHNNVEIIEDIYSALASIKTFWQKSCELNN